MEELRELREAQYKLLLAVKEKAEENKNDKNNQNYFKKRETVTFEQLETICAGIPDLCPGEPYKINNERPWQQRFAYFEGGFAYRANINSLFEYQGFSAISISQKALFLMEKYRKNLEDTELRKREVEAAEKASDAAQKVAFEIKNQNMVQKNLLQDINASLQGINSAEVLKKDSLSKLSSDISDLTKIASYNIKDMQELGRIKEKASTKVRKNIITFYIIFSIVLLAGLVSTILLFVRLGNEENKVIWEFVFSIIPMVLELVLCITKDFIIKNEEYYICKYSKTSL